MTSASETHIIQLVLANCNHAKLSSKQLPESQRHLQAVVEEAQQATAGLPGAAGAAEGVPGTPLEGGGGPCELLTAA